VLALVAVPAYRHFVTHDGDALFGLTTAHPTKGSHQPAAEHSRFRGGDYAATGVDRFFFQVSKGLEGFQCDAFALVNWC
jgi:hypothetical protein